MSLFRSVLLHQNYLRPGEEKSVTSVVPSVDDVSVDAIVVKEAANDDVSPPVKEGLELGPVIELGLGTGLGSG